MDGGTELETLLAAARDLYLVHFFQRIREAEADPAPFEIEPVCLDAKGEILRGGILGLPRRDAILQQPTGGEPVRGDVETPVLPVERLALRPKPNLLLNMRPFSWNRLWIKADPRCGGPLLGRVRLWYLDWFQARVSSESPGLRGVVHRLDGPHELEDAHWFCANFGTAPIDAATTLIDLLSDGGVRRIQIGDHPNRDSGERFRM